MSPPSGSESPEQHLDSVPDPRRLGLGFSGLRVQGLEFGVGGSQSGAARRPPESCGDYSATPNARALGLIREIHIAFHRVTFWNRVTLRAIHIYIYIVS